MTKVSHIWKTLLSPFGFAALLAYGLSYGRQPQQDAPAAHQQALENKQFETAANKWMKLPVDVRTQIDPIPSDQRQARDAHCPTRSALSASLSLAI